MWWSSSKCESVSSSFVSGSLWPHGIYSPPGSSAHGILQARILESGWPFPSPGEFPDGKIHKIAVFKYWTICGTSLRILRKKKPYEMKFTVALILSRRNFQGRKSQIEHVVSLNRGDWNWGLEFDIAEKTGICVAENQKWRR